MNTLAQMMLVFTTAAGGNIPSPIEMETAAAQALTRHEIVANKFQSGIRSSTHDFVLTRIGRKDDSDAPVSSDEVAQIAQAIATQTKCTLTTNTSFGAPVISEGPAMKIDWKPYYRFEFSCP